MFTFRWPPASCVSTQPGDPLPCAHKKKRTTATTTTTKVFPLVAADGQIPPQHRSSNPPGTGILPINGGTSQPQPSSKTTHTHQRRHTVLRPGEAPFPWNEKKKSHRIPRNRRKKNGKNAIRSRLIFRFRHWHFLHHAIFSKKIPAKITRELPTTSSDRFFFFGLATRGEQVEPAANYTERSCGSNQQQRRGVSNEEENRRTTERWLQQ